VLPRVAVALALLAALLLAPAPPAHADGDPASDVLLGTDVFFPYTPVSHPAEVGLTRAVAELRAAHRPLKVALIASPQDLGVIPQLFDHAQQYGAFLEREISFNGPPELLVVMPAGYGTQNTPPAATQALAELPRPSGRSGTALALAATAAVSRIAAAEGHPLKGVSRTPAGAGSGGGNGSGTTVIVIVLVALAVITAGALTAVTLRRRQPAR
jgi:hypothetical protein